MSLMLFAALLAGPAAAVSTAAPPEARSSAPACSSGTVCSTVHLSALHRPDGSAAPASALEVSSWSWGASNPSSSREAGSGLATGRRQHLPARGKVSLSDLSITSSSVGPCDSSRAGASCPAAGTISATLSESSRKGWDGCVKGSHIASAQLRSSSGASFDFDDLHVEACDASSGAMTLRYAAVRESPSRPSTR